jgi:hypothetical protein
MILPLAIDWDARAPEAVHAGHSPWLSTTACRTRADVDGAYGKRYAGGLALALAYGLEAASTAGFGALVELTTVESPTTRAVDDPGAARR